MLQTALHYRYELLGESEEELIIQDRLMLRMWWNGNVSNQETENQKIIYIVCADEAFENYDNYYEYVYHKPKITINIAPKETNERFIGWCAVFVFYCKVYWHIKQFIKYIIQNQGKTMV